jgi:FixJ family two-component response regulator
MEEVVYQILIVDDDPDLLEALKSMLKVYNYRVDTASNVNAAIKKVTENKYDLIVSDIEMPGRTGLEFLEQLKKGMLIEIPVVLMTGHLSVDYAIEAVRLGAADFIKKPIESKVILKSINHQLIKKRIQQKKEKIDHKVNLFYSQLSFTPYDFLNQSIPEYIIHYISKNIRIPLKIINELSICVEEIISNAFLHGTLDVPSDVRKKSYRDYIDFINEELNSGKSDKKVTVEIRYNNEDRILRLTTTDQGKGFNTEYYVRNNQPLLNFDSATGRGLNLIQILSDRILFAENGTKITIEKFIPENEFPLDH